MKFPFFSPGDIIFNAQYPELPPDFIFGEDAEFLPEPSELPVSNLHLWEHHSFQVFVEDLKHRFKTLKMWFYCTVNI